MTADGRGIRCEAEIWEPAKKLFRQRGSNINREIRAFLLRSLLESVPSTATSDGMPGPSEDREDDSDHEADNAERGQDTHVDEVADNKQNDAEDNQRNSL